ncbi:hypothetical protein [Nonomuraea wenchangensis]
MEEEKRPWHRRWEPPKPQDVAMIIVRAILIVVEVILKAGR